MRNAAWSNGRAWLYQGKDIEVLREIPDGAVQCIVTSPPYFGLRDYGVTGQRGLEASPAEYIAGLVELYREARRVLADDGVFFLNIGDSYQSSGGHASQGANSARRGRANVEAQNASKVRSGLPEKSLLMIPARTAIALQDDGWTLRNDVIWRKTNPMPYSGTDRFASTYEHIYMFSKSRRYYFDLDAVRSEPVGATRPQRKRAELLWIERGLTPAHLDAIHAIGMNDAGKAKVVQSGSGKNTPDMMRLADEAKAALGGYFREFLTAQSVEGHPLGKNPGDVWDISTRPFAEAHFAVYPPDVPERCILAGSRPGDIVLDPASGSGTTGMVALKHGRRYVGIELNQEYIDLSIRTRFAD